MRTLAVALASALVVGCGDNQDPNGARALYAQVKSGAGYRAWERAPGFPSRKPSFTAHGDAVEIFVSEAVSEALAGPSPVTAWPTGSVIVKESYSGGALSQLAMMEKKPDGSWFWAEYAADGTAISSGKPDACVTCHGDRKVYSDWVYAFEFPR